MSEWMLVCKEEDIPAGSYTSKNFDGTQITVFNLDGDYYALEDICSHDGAVIIDGQKIEGAEIVCPRHGAKFCIRTGEVLSPPAYDPLTKFPLKIESGKIFVRDHRWD